MKIRKINAINYKCFKQIGPIDYSPKFNVIVGKNNAGKTALLELMSLKYSDNPHKSMVTLPYPGASLKPKSTISLEFEVEYNELKNIFVDNFPEFVVERKQDMTAEDLVSFLSRDKLLITGTYSPNQFNESTYFSKLGNYKTGNYSKLTWNRDDDVPKIKNANIRRNLRDIKHDLINCLAQRIYFFKAERFNVGEHRVGRTIKLESDASNLAQVLNYLQTSNRVRFNRLLNYVKNIFPEIKDISVPPSTKSDHVEIRIWYIDPSTERDDLSFSLEESGTGVGQVLSILFVVITSEEAHPILIDEPQSFLHPGAIRKLFSILSQDFPQHQYIVSTHSPVVISAMNPEKIISLEKLGIESKAYPVKKRESVEMEKVLSSVGARLSDVFGADNILWVEGKTEEDCFPLIVKDILDKPLMGTVILGVLNTGDFERRDAERIYRIYEKLSKGKSLLPPAIGILLDRENRTEQEIEDLDRMSDGDIKFINRKMYENYLLNPKAIAHVITENNQKYSDKKKYKIKPIDINNWIEEHGDEDKYISDFSGDNLVENNNWLTNVDGANLLRDIFNNFADSIPYEKTYHGLEITKWIVEDSPEDLDEIAFQIDDSLR